MDGDFTPLFIVGNRGGLHAYEISKALDTEARLVELTKKIVVGHGGIKSLFNETLTHRNMRRNQKNRLDLHRSAPQVQRLVERSSLGLIEADIRRRPLLAQTGISLKLVNCL